MTHSSVKVARRLVDSAEFSEWLAYWELTAELSGAIDRPPTPEELGGKLTAWATFHNAKEHGKVTREPR